MEEPESSTIAPSPRVEGWTHYYEYFHQLSADMQVSATPGPACTLFLHHFARVVHATKPFVSQTPVSRCQCTTELAAQRTSCPDLVEDELFPPLAAVSSSKGSKVKTSSTCFESIAAAIKCNDKPLVHIEDDEDGVAVRAHTPPWAGSHQVMHRFLPPSTSAHGCRSFRMGSAASLAGGR